MAAIADRRIDGQRKPRAIAARKGLISSPGDLGGFMRFLKPFLLPMRQEMHRVELSPILQTNGHHMQLNINDEKSENRIIEYSNNSCLPSDFISSSTFWV